MRTAAAMIGLTLALALVAPATPAAAPARKGATTRDWSATVTRAPSGAFVVGNPQAKVRVVEYTSMTCSHCAAFAVEGLPALRADAIRRGLVSLELRHAVRDGADLAAALLARCGGPRGYLAAMDRLFAAQAEWLPRAAAAPIGGGGDSPAERQAALTGLARAAGLPAIVRIAPAAAAACLANPAEQAVLGRMATEAWGERRITGTPAFLIDDRLVQGSSWSTLAPQIAAALR